MYKLKQQPEDFAVQEVNNLNLDKSGKYFYFLLKKKGHNSMDAIRQVAKAAGIDADRIGFSGNKDRNAVTEQVISVYGISRKDIEKFEDLKLENIEVTHAGNGNKEVYIGSNWGNEFFIIIRNLSSEEAEKIKKAEFKKILMPNFFGEQRFGKDNVEIGRAIIKKDFKKAAEMVIRGKGRHFEKVAEHLRKEGNDFTGALRKIPIKLFRFYIHAYQSYIFNEALRQYIKFNDFDLSKIKDKKLPIVENIMSSEKTGFRDFILREFPDGSQEGDQRLAVIGTDGFRITDYGDDELNSGKKKARINFALPKGCYATVFIENLFA